MTKSCAKLAQKTQISGGGVEDTRLEAKAKDTKKRGQGQPLPRTEPLETKDRNARGQGQGPWTQAQVFSKRKSLQFFFQAISNRGNKKRSSQIFCIQPFFIKVARFVIAPYLSLFLIFVFTEGIFPSNCKVARVILVY